MRTIIALLLSSIIALYSLACFAYYKDEVPARYSNNYQYQPEVTACGSDECPDPRYQQGDASNFRMASNDSWDDRYGYIRGEPCSSCYCTDPGYHWNTCINGSEYCEAFGNPGAR